MAASTTHLDSVTLMVRALGATVLSGFMRVTVTTITTITTTLLTGGAARRGQR